MLSELEGGYQNLTSDPGNKNSLGVYVGTNWGISARFYEQIIGYPPTVQDMKNLTKEEAKNIYRIHFWDKLKASEIKSQQVANTIVDMQVNSGRGARIAQQVLNTHFGKNLNVDGVIGPKTIQAINSVPPSEFVDKYNDARISYYKGIGNTAWIRIWVNRVKKFAYQNTASLSIVSLFVLGGLGYLIFKNV